MPGIIGRSAGKRHVSGGVFTTGEKTTAMMPTMNAATSEAVTMCSLTPNSGVISMNLTACPIAAIAAQ